MQVEDHATKSLNANKINRKLMESGCQEHMVGRQFIDGGQTDHRFPTQQNHIYMIQNMQLISGSLTAGQPMIHHKHPDPNGQYTSV